MNFTFNGDRPYKSNGQFNWKSQSAYIEFNYRLGIGKNKAIQRKQRDKIKPKAVVELYKLLVPKKNPEFANSGFFI